MSEVRIWTPDPVRFVASALYGERWQSPPRPGAPAPPPGDRRIPGRRAHPGAAKPAMALGAAPTIKMPPLRTPPPKAPRKVTGPDEQDLLIPF